MGIALWLTAGVAAFATARFIPWERRSWRAELAVSLAIALLLGVTATALDFGGWNEPDWRAAIFAFAGAFAAVGLLRALRAARMRPDTTAR